MTFCLNSTIIKPENNLEIKNAIILLHGYGGDGKDISMLSLNWKRYLPNTLFICPDGHEICPINPSGFQWFDLTKNDPKYILNESIKAERILNKFINEIKKEFNLKIIKNISIKNENDLYKIDYYENIDYLLFDYKPNMGELPGGNSKSFDWNLLNKLKIKIPWFVSGGINESNIKNIQKTINPHGIDLSSGVEESLGKKNNEKINNLFRVFYDN